MAHIVIVDDDVDMADLLFEFLRSKGHAVRVAHDGAEGLELIRSSRPDAILLDVEMPVMTGPDMAMNLLIHDCGLEQIPIVLCSGILNLDAIARHVGTPYFLPKPCPLDALEHVLSTALVERRRPHPQPQPWSA